jgi:hypothetical protein
MAFSRELLPVIRRLGESSRGGLAVAVAMHNGFLLSADFFLTVVPELVGFQAKDC